MQTLTSPTLFGHRLTSQPARVSTGPHWECSCGRVFTDPETAAQHSIASIGPRRPR